MISSSSISVKSTAVFTAILFSEGRFAWRVDGSGEEDTNLQTTDYIQSELKENEPLSPTTLLINLKSFS